MLMTGGMPSFLHVGQTNVPLSLHFGVVHGEGAMVAIGLVYNKNTGPMGTQSRLLYACTQK